MGTDYGILRREIVRQSLLLAARDDFGFRVRDGSLGETAPASLAASQRLLVESTMRQEKAGSVVVKQGEQKSPKPVLSIEVDRKINEGVNLAPVVEASAGWARNEFAAILKQVRATLGSPGRSAMGIEASGQGRATLERHDDYFAVRGPARHPRGHARGRRIARIARGAGLGLREPGCPDRTSLDRRSQGVQARGPWCMPSVYCIASPTIRGGSGIERTPRHYSAFTPQLWPTCKPPAKERPPNRRPNGLALIEPSCLFRRSEDCRLEREGRAREPCLFSPVSCR